MDIDKPIEYEVFKTRQGVVASAIMGAIAIAMAFSIFVEITEGGEHIVELIPVAVFIIIPLIGIFLAVKQIKTGIRHVRINGNAVTLTYPNDMIDISTSQMYDLKTRKRKDNGKYKGRVRFQGSDGNKYSISFRFEKSGGQAAFEWFEKIEQEIKAKTG